MPDLLSGTPVTGVVPTQSSSVSSLPDWYTNYAKDIIDQQAQLSSQPFTPYQGPRVAAFTPDQTTAFGQTEAASTLAQPGYSTAIGLAGSAAPLSASASASPWFSRAGALNPTGTAAPLQNAGVGYLQKSVDPLGLEAAAPFLGSASQSGVSNIDSYMNPYTTDVVNRIGQLAGRTLSEDILPNIQDQFTAAGQGTSGSRQGEYVGRAIRDLGESTTAAQSQALQAGYSQAQQTAEADLARQAALAGTAGSLGAAQQGALQQAGVGTAGIGTAAGNLGISEQGVLGNLGVDAGNLTTQDVNNLLNEATTIGNLSSGQQAAALTGAGALQTAGTEQQALDQQNLNTAYGDFQAQQQWPQQQLNNMTSTVGALVNTLPKQVQSAGTQPATAYNPSTVATLASLGLDAATIAKILGG